LADQEPLLFVCGSDEALLRHRQILDLRRPFPGQIKALDEWMHRPSMGNVYLEGLDRKIWSEPDLDDMVSLVPTSPEDNFTTDFTVKLVHKYNRLLGRHIHVFQSPHQLVVSSRANNRVKKQREETKDFLHNTIRYRDEGVFRVLKILSTLVASLLPVASIAVLYAIQNMPARIGAVAAFTALFSFSLSVITSASTKDIFSATAAWVMPLLYHI
jgi:hypothetical protein